ncbi:MAG: hypothetical protein ACFCGT_27735 [Sandaracinaceae bacterium]
MTDRPPTDRPTYRDPHFAAFVDHLADALERSFAERPVDLDPAPDVAREAGRVLEALEAGWAAARRAYRTARLTAEAPSGARR